jgi:hypothetical protein
MAGSIGGAIRRRGAMRTALLLLAAAGIVASCGRSPLPPSNAARPLGTLTEQEQVAFDLTDRAGARRGGFFDLFRNQDDANVTVEVNRYLWNATLEILDFLPVESADPFSGVITYGFGTPPGGGRAYRATVLIRDPALDARSLNVALVTRGGGPASAETVRAVEDAILTRARQLRIADSRL